MNQVVLIGRLTKDPELKYIPTTGTAVCTFSIAVGRGVKNKDGKEDVDYIVVRSWNKSAENCANYLVKGSLVAVNGSMRVDKYVHEDNNKTFTYVNSNRVQFLSSKKKEDGFNPAGAGLDPQGFQAIDDEDLPF